MKKENRITDDLLRYGSLGIEMLVMILIGTGVGYWLDGRWKTRPWFMLLGFLLGSAAGFRGILRLMKTEEKGKSEKTKEKSNKSIP